MKAKIMGRTIEIPDDRVRGGVVGTRRESIGLKGVVEQSKASETPVHTGKTPALPVRSMPIIGGAGSNPAPSPYRSKLEAAYARALEFDRIGGLILGFQYEPMNIRLSGEKNFYKPDFLVWSADHRPTFYEVKGRNKSDDRSLVKTKVAASLHPWARFFIVKRVRGAWETREIRP